MLTALNTVGKQPGRRALVVFSDGEDQNSVATLKRVETRLETSDATIYTIGLGRSIKDKELAQVLARMSQMSGGPLVSARRHQRAREGLRRHRRGAVEPVPAVVRLVQRRARRQLAQDPGGAARAEAPRPPSAGLPSGRGKEEAMTSRTLVGWRRSGCSAAVTVGAQQPPAPPAQPTFRASTELIAIDATVVTDRGEPVADLTAEDFVLTHRRLAAARGHGAVHQAGSARAAADARRSQTPLHDQ